MVRSVDPGWLEEHDGYSILDVRTREDFEQRHIRHEAIVNTYYRKFEEEDVDIEEKVPDVEPIVVVCWRGKCSEMIARKLQKEGFEAYSLSGGMASLT